MASEFKVGWKYGQKSHVISGNTTRSLCGHRDLVVKEGDKTTYNLVDCEKCKRSVGYPFVHRLFLDKGKWHYHNFRDDNNQDCKGMLGEQK